MTDDEKRKAAIEDMVFNVLWWGYHAWGVMGVLFLLGANGSLLRTLLGAAVGWYCVTSATKSLNILHIQHAKLVEARAKK